MTLERATLLLDLEHDVVHAGEVLLGSFELQLGGAAPGLVLRDAGGLFDQLPSIGWTRAQDLADLALLDDRIGLHTEAGIHEQVLHVPQPDGFAVDQVFAFPRSVQPPHDLDVTHHERLFFERHRGRCGQFPVAANQRMRSAELTRLITRDPRRDARQLQPDFRRAGRFPRIAASEDHVLHAIAAQALGALFPEHPRQRVDDVALAAAVRADDRGDTIVERQLGSIWKTLEPDNFQALKPHAVQSLPMARQKKSRSGGQADKPRPGSGWVRFGNLRLFGGCDVTTKTVRPCPHPTQSGMAPGRSERASV